MELGSATLLMTVEKTLNVSLNISDLVPGDTIIREFNVLNDGNVSFNYYLYLNYPNNTTPSLLWTGIHGLTFQVTDDGTGNSIGNSNTVNAFGPSTPISFSTLHPEESTLIEIEITLPVLADNTYQNLQQDIILVFYAEQLTGTSR